MTEKCFESFQIFYFRRWNRMKWINDGIISTFIAFFFFRELWSITLKNSFNDRIFCQNCSYFCHYGEEKKIGNMSIFCVFLRIFLNFSSINDWKCFESFQIFYFGRWNRMKWINDGIISTFIAFLSRIMIYYVEKLVQWSYVFKSFIFGGEIGWNE